MQATATCQSHARRPDGRSVKPADALATGALLTLVYIFGRSFTTWFVGCGLLITFADRRGLLTDRGQLTVVLACTLRGMQAAGSAIYDLCVLLHGWFVRDVLPRSEELGVELKDLLYEGAPPTWQEGATQFAEACGRAFVRLATFIHAVMVEHERTPDPYEGSVLMRRMSSRSSTSSVADTVAESVAELLSGARATEKGAEATPDDAEKVPQLPAVDRVKTTADIFENSPTRIRPRDDGFSAALSTPPGPVCRGPSSSEAMATPEKGVAPGAHSPITPVTIITRLAEPIDDAEQTPPGTPPADACRSPLSARVHRSPVARRVSFDSPGAGSESTVCDTIADETATPPPRPGSARSGLARRPSAAAIAAVKEAAQVAVAREAAAKEAAEKDEKARVAAAKIAAVKEAVAKEAAAVEAAAKEAAAREAAAREAAAKEAAAAREEAVREAVAREVAAMEAAVREAVAREVAAKEAAVREAVAREVAAKDAAMRAAAARELAAREAGARAAAKQEAVARAAEARAEAAKKAAAKSAAAKPAADAGTADVVERVAAAVEAAAVRAAQAEAAAAKQAALSQKAAENSAVEAAEAMKRVLEAAAAAGKVAEKAAERAVATAAEKAVATAAEAAVERVAAEKGKGGKGEAEKAAAKAVKAAEKAAEKAMRAAGEAERAAADAAQRASDADEQSLDAERCRAPQRLRHQTRPSAEDLERWDGGSGEFTPYEPFDLKKVPRTSLAAAADNARASHRSSPPPEDELVDDLSDLDEYLSTSPVPLSNPQPTAPNEDEVASPSPAPAEVGREGHSLDDVVSGVAQMASERAARATAERGLARATSDPRANRQPKPEARKARSGRIDTRSGRIDARDTPLARMRAAARAAEAAELKEAKAEAAAQAAAPAPSGTLAASVGEWLDEEDDERERREHVAQAELDEAAAANQERARSRADERLKRRLSKFGICAPFDEMRPEYLEQLYDYERAGFSSKHSMAKNKAGQMATATFRSSSGRFGNQATNAMAGVKQYENPHSPTTHLGPTDTHTPQNSRGELWGTNMRASTRWHMVPDKEPKPLSPRKRFGKAAKLILAKNQVDAGFADLAAIASLARAQQAKQRAEAAQREAEAEEKA